MKSRERVVTVTMNEQPDEAPHGKILMCWGAGGWRFMVKNEVGQWRSIVGRPKPPPKYWAYPPEMKS